MACAPSIRLSVTLPVIQMVSPMYVRHPDLTHGAVAVGGCHAELLGAFGLRMRNGPPFSSTTAASKSNVEALTVSPPSSRSSQVQLASTRPAILDFTHREEIVKSP
jgi:hypothetical protein